MLGWIRAKLYAGERARVVALILEQRSYYDERVFAPTNTSYDGRLAFFARGLADRLLHGVTTGAEAMVLSQTIAMDQLAKLIPQADTRPLDDRMKNCRHGGITKDAKGEYRCTTCTKVFKVQL